MTLVQPWMEVVVSARWQDAEDVVVLQLADPAHRDLPPFSAGSHIDVEVAPGLVRQYSLSNHNEERRRYEIGVLREAVSRGGSVAVHDGLPVGSTVRISAPRNHFPLEAAAHESLLFAGGIGITPILCMAERLHYVNATFRMHYCARTSARMAYRQRILDAPFSDRVQLHLDDGPAEQRLDLPLAIGAYAQHRHIYVCGPAAFIEAVLSAARAAGWPETSLHREYFVAPEGIDAIDRPFEVRLARTGQTFLIPADRTVVDVLAEAGIEIPTSCAQGVCGTCLTHLLSGDPDHRDYFLTAEERALNNQFTPCCSRAKSAVLVLDM